MSLHEFDSVHLLLGDPAAQNPYGQNIIFSTRREYPVFCGRCLNFRKRPIPAGSIAPALRGRHRLQRITWSPLAPTARSASAGTHSDVEQICGHNADRVVSPITLAVVSEGDGRGTSAKVEIVAARETMQ